MAAQEKARFCFRDGFYGPSMQIRVILALTKDLYVLPTQSTGEGTESSGSGRYEWGTWINDDLLKQVRQAVDTVGLKGSSELWPALWDVVGGEQSSGRMLVGKGKDWACYLHVFMTTKEQGNVEKFRGSHPTGECGLMCGL